MSWRTVVISQNAKLDYQLGFLVVRQDRTTKIHLSEISNLIIETTQVSMTAYLLSELVKKKIKVIFCDEKRNPSSELVPYYGCHDTSLKIRSQIAWPKEIKDVIWTEIVADKIYQQEMNLQVFGHEEYKLLQQYIEEMQLGDTTNREGHAAKVYFNALFGRSFTRADDSGVNAALNYGYSILLSAFNREISANGYLTQIGLFHDNMFNPFNLSSDLMEPFRAIVDRYVVRMAPEQFEQEEKREVLKILQQEVIIGERRECINNAIKIYVRSIFEALNLKDPSIIKFYRNEL